MITNRRNRSIRAAATAAVAVLVSGACSVGTYEQARPVDDAPEELLAPATTESIPEQPAEEDDFTLTLMFIDSDERRVPVVRSQDQRPSEQDVLDGLAVQPSEEEQAEHPDNPISTRLFSSLNPVSQGVTGGELRVMTAGEELRTANPERVRTIYGQIVCSMAELEPANRVESVLLLDATGAIDAPTENASVLDPNQAARPEDYSDCATADEMAVADAEATIEADAEEEPSDDG